jgi:cytochrome c biogenesis protein CcmG/thiol:disulfide interchange protein DsbE
MRAALIAVAVGGLLGAACGAAPKPADTAAPGFDLPALDGGRVSLASLKGKVVVLDFWATWCTPCIAEMPHYAQLAEKNRARGVEVLGVVFDSGEPQDVQDFVRENRIAHRQLLGSDDLIDKYNATSGFPTTFVIDQQGVIRLRILGATPQKFERLQKAVDAALLAASAPAAAGG